jgi:Glycosyl hydrolases family 28
MDRWWDMFTPLFLVQSHALLAVLLATPGATPTTPATPSPPAPPPIFEIRVGGESIPTHDLSAAAFAQFEITRPVEVSIRTEYDVRWVDIRPRSAHIEAAISPDHSTIRFTVTKPVALTIEFNGDWKRVVHLFANPPEKSPPPTDASKVRRFGPGLHEVGEIVLQDGESVYLEKGSWVKGNITAVKARNITISGRGVLDGDFATPEPPPGAKKAQSYGGNRNMIRLEDVQNARIEGITIVNSKTWTVFLRRTKGIRISGVNILNAGSPCATDGIDVVSSSDVLIEDIFIRTNDDNIAVKNLDSAERVSDITVRRAVFWNEKCGNAVEIGFELRTGVLENIRFEDIDIIRVERGAAISIHNGDSATVKNVVFDNLRVEDARHKLIDFAIVWGAYGKDRPASREDRQKMSDRGGAWDAVMRAPPEVRKEHAVFRGHVENIMVRNLHVVEGPFPFSVIAGYDEAHLVKGVTIENLRVGGKRIRTAKEAKLSSEFAPGLRFR